MFFKIDIIYYTLNEKVWKQSFLFPLTVYGTMVKRVMTESYLSLVYLL